MDADDNDQQGATYVEDDRDVLDEEAAEEAEIESGMDAGVTTGVRPRRAGAPGC